MTKKRKSRAAVTPQQIEQESIQHDEPDPEQPVAEEFQQVGEEEEPVVGGVGNDEAEEMQGELQGGEGDEEEELKDESSLEKNEQDTVISDNHVQNDVSANGGDAEGINDGNEDEGELEEEPLEKMLEPFTKDQLTLLIKEAVTKHPEILENVHKFAEADPSSRKIFVHGLGWDANSEMITSVFMNFGEVEDCKVVVDKTSGKAKGYAFLLFKQRKGARRALKEPQKMIGGRMTSCQLASAGPVPAPPPVGAVTSGPHVSEYTQRKIYVSNVSAEIEVSKLVEFFSKFGEIEEGPLGLDKQTGKPRGFCLFVYKSAESAIKALQEPHKKFEGQILHCQKAVDGPKHSKGGYFNPQQGYSPHMQPQHQPQHHSQGQQGYYQHTAKRGKYAGSSGGMLHTGGHLMAPSAGSSMPAMGFNQTAAVPPAAIGQAVAALLATQGAGLGIGNLLGGIGTGVNPQVVNNVGYGGASGYGGQSALQYGGQPQTGQGGVRPHQGGPGYMGHGH